VIAEDIFAALSAVKT